MVACDNDLVSCIVVSDCTQLCELVLVWLFAKPLVELFDLIGCTRVGEVTGVYQDVSRGNL